MALKICDYDFQVLEKVDDLNDSPGVYAIITVKDNNASLVDVGESENLKNRILNHDRVSCWGKYENDGLAVAVHYTDKAQETERREIERVIRDQYQPPCGGQPQGANE